MQVQLNRCAADNKGYANPIVNAPHLFAGLQQALADVVRFMLRSISLSSHLAGMVDWSTHDSASCHCCAAEFALNIILSKLLLNIRTRKVVGSLSPWIFIRLQVAASLPLQFFSINGSQGLHGQGCILLTLPRPCISY